MLKRFEIVVPDLAKQSSVIGDWAGIRASTPIVNHILEAIKQ